MRLCRAASYLRVNKDSERQEQRQMKTTFSNVGYIGLTPIFCKNRESFMDSMKKISTFF